MRASIRLVAIACLAAAGPAHARARVDRLPPSTRLTLDNGFEAILIPNRAAPLVTSVVVVRAGSACEQPSTSGVSHMLEHLLFNGTARRSQAQIRQEQDRHGFINNAHTSTGHTAYFVMAPRESAGRALDLQSDMLFGSTFADETFAQEREVIVNEIAKDRARDETIMADFFAGRLFLPGGPTLPVTGTPDSVRAMPRDAVLAHYRAWYLPNNMTAIIMGDFEPDEMAPLVRRYFGAAPPGPVEPPVRAELNPAALGRSHARRIEGPSRLVWMGAAAPALGDADLGPAWLLASLLSQDLIGGVNSRLRSKGAGGLLLEASFSIDEHAGRSSYVARARLEPGLAWEEASGALLAEIAARIAAEPWKSGALDALRLEARATGLRLWEKPHYYGLDVAPRVAAAGWEYARDFVSNLGWIEPADLKQASRPLADPASWGIFYCGPDAPADSWEGVPASSASRRPGGPTPRSVELVRGWKGPQESSSGSAELPARGRPAASAGQLNIRTVLPNGIALTLDSTDDSRVFAASVLVRNRLAAEPAGREGIADLLHRLAGSGTRGHPAGDLERALREIGGSLKVIDDAAIPYDDIYLSPEYSYVRLEALDEFAPEALELLREILAEPLLDDERALALAREQQIDRARQWAASAREQCRLLMARGLWGAGHPFARAPFGTEESIRAVTKEELASFHATYFSPRNLILGVGTSIDPERILPLLERTLGRWTTGSPEPRVKLPAPPDPAGGGAPRVAAGSMATPQACLAWGRLAPPAPRALPALETLAAVLSRRMGASLRERKGLSYSLGAEAAPLGDRIQLTATMGLLPEKLEEARAGLREVIDSLVSEPPGQQEIDDARRSSSVRAMMRELSRINRAHARCLAELRRQAARGTPPAAEPPAGPLTAELLLATARRLIEPGRMESWVEAMVAPGPEPGAPPPAAGSR